ncbi:MAG: sigma-70 family RNA polymerase sigma factor [Planctomycetota bacterium]
MATGGQHNGEPEDGRLTREAFESLFAQTYSSLVFAATAVVGQAEAEDAVQEGALVALARLDRFTPGTDFRAWMSAIVRGVAKNHRRATRRRERRHADATGRAARAERAPDGMNNAGRPAGAARAPGDRSPVDVRLSDDFDADVRHAVDALEPLQRASLLLRVVLGHSYAEIGVLLGIREATARSHVLRARRKLAKSLGATDDASAS